MVILLYIDVFLTYKTLALISFAKELKTCQSGFLDFVHRLYVNRIATFRKLDLLPSSGKKEEQKP
jgi:hypothetical protein